MTLEDYNLIARSITYWSIMIAVWSVFLSYVSFKLDRDRLTFAFALIALFCVLVLFVIGSVHLLVVGQAWPFHTLEIPQ